MPEELSAPQDEVTWFGRLSSPGLEAEFRNRQWPNDFARMRLVSLASCIAYAAFVVTDYMLFEFSPPFWRLAIVRLLFLASTAVALYFLPRRSDWRSRDTLVAFWMVALTASTLYVNSTRPADFMGHFLVDVVVVMFLYAVIPAPPALQAAVAVLFSVCVSVLFLGSAAPHPGITLNAMLVSLVLSNVVGTLVSRDLSRSKREQFLALRRVEAQSAHLRQALSEIRTLQGIIPICASCKKVRDDSGYWRQVEEFVATHSAAEFSHGLCPQCLETFRHT